MNIFARAKKYIYKKITRMLKLICENFWLIFWIIVLSLIVLSVSDYYYKYFDLISRTASDNGKNISIDAFHSIEISLLTLILIVVAWIQLRSLNKTGTADFLLRIDERFSNSEIIEARAYIHAIYSQLRPKCRHGERGEVCHDCHLYHMQKIRDKIKSKRHKKNFAKTFSQLRSLLELFETIGYFSKKEYVDSDDINELVGGTIEFHYEVFRDWIHYLQDTKSPSNFLEFERLVYKINPELVPIARRDKYK